MAGPLSALLKIGGQAAQVGGAAAEGLGQDKAIALQQAFAARAQNRDDLLANIKAQLDAAQAKKLTHDTLAPVLGEKGPNGEDLFAAAQGNVAGAEARAKVDPTIAQNVGSAIGTGEVAKNLAEAAKTTHENQAPVLGEPGYAGAEGAVAGAESQAKLPAEREIAALRAGMTPLVVRAREALPQIDSALSTLSKYNDPGLAGRLFTRSTLGQFTLSPEGQNALQGYTQLAHAYNTGMNQRAPTPQQDAELVRTIMPQGTEMNNPTVIKQKAQRMQQMRDEVAGHAGAGVGGTAPQHGAPDPDFDAVMATLKPKPPG